MSERARLCKRRLRFSTVCIVAAALLAAIVPVAHGCSTCSAIGGIGLSESTGAVWTEPVVASVDLGPAGPGRSDAASLPGVATIRNLGTSTAPVILFGNSVITLSGSTVLVDGVARPGWSWSSTYRRLTAPDDSTYVFNSSRGMLASVTTSKGRTTTITYHATYADRPTQAIDSFGNVWTYEVNASKPGPSAVIDPDGIHKVVFTYREVGTYGAGQYDTITVYKKSGSTWIEQERTTYDYNGADQIVQVSTASWDESTQSWDTSDASTTSVAYDNGKVQRVYNEKLRSDTTYGFGSEDVTTSGGTNTYGTTTKRLRANYGSDTDTEDIVTKRVYYRDANGKNKNLFRTVQQIYDGSAWVDHATTENRIYGYNSRFTDAPTEVSSLAGKPWKIVDARGNATTYEYYTTNGLTKKITPPTSDPTNIYTYYWYKQVGGVDTAYVEKERDERGKYTRYTRSATYPALITQIDVSDDGSIWTPVRYLSYYSTPAQKLNLLYQDTLPDIEGQDDKVTTYDYSETVNGVTCYHSSPTSETCSWWNGSSYEDKTKTTSYYRDGRTRWSKDRLNNQTDYSYDTQGRLAITWLPADPGDCGTGSCSGSTLTDNTKAWYADELAGMALLIGTNWYPITANTGQSVTVSGTLPTASGQAYTIRAYTQTGYSACCGNVEWQQDARGKRTYYGYDHGRVSEVRNDVTGESSANALGSFTYNDLGQRTEIRTYQDASDTTGRLIEYSYDQLGRMKQTVRPYEATAGDLLWNTYYQRNVMGKVVAKLVGVVNGGSITSGTVKVYEYDSLNRVSKVDYDYSATTWPISGAQVNSYGDISIANPDVTYQYDGGSELESSITEGSLVSSYTYDAQGQVLTYTPPLPANYRVRYNYNAAGEKTEVVVQQNNSGWVDKYRSAYSYFKNGWLKEVNGQEWTTSWQNRTRSTFKYDAASQRTDRNTGSSLTDVWSHYVFDARGNLASIDHKSADGQSNYYQVGYVRDGKGYLLKSQFGGSMCPSAYAGQSVTRSYDAQGRITSETVGNGTPATWDYDWLGNQGTGTDYNKVDEYLAGSGYVYDKLGNLQYVPSQSASTRTEYSYGPGNLISQVNDVVNGSGTITEMTWAEHRKLQLQRGSDTWQFIYDPTASSPSVLLAIGPGDAKTHYTREPAGELLACYDGQAASNYYFDDAGSTVLMSNGSPTAGYAWDFWGNKVGYSMSPSAGLPFLFMGQSGCYQFDPSGSQGTALGDLMESRGVLYVAQAGRFTQAVPKGSIASPYAADKKKDPPKKEEDPKFEGCSDDQNKELGAALKTLCDAINGGKCSSCASDKAGGAGGDCMKNICKKPKVKCKPDDDKECKGTGDQKGQQLCGSSSVCEKGKPHPGGTVIMCELAWTGDCDTYSTSGQGVMGTLLHEMSHLCGDCSEEGNESRVDACLKEIFPPKKAEKK